MTSSHASVRGFDLAILVVGVCAVSTAALLIREAEAPSMVIAAPRLALASLPLLAIEGVQRVRGVGGAGTAPTDDARRQLALTLLAGVFMALHFGFWVASVKQTSIV